MTERRRRRTSALTDRAAQILRAHTALEAARVEYRAVIGAPPPPILMADALRSADPDASLVERYATVTVAIRAAARDVVLRAAGYGDDPWPAVAASETPRERVTRPVRLETSGPAMGTAADRLNRLAEAVGIAVGSVAASVGHDAHVVRHRTPSDPTCWGPGPREVGCYAEGVDPLGLCVPCRAAIEARTPTSEG